MTHRYESTYSNLRYNNFRRIEYISKGECSSRLHRKNGPAVIIFKHEGLFRIEWWVDGMAHREDGPAINWKDGRVGFDKWYLNGCKYEQAHWFGKILKAKLEF